MNAPVTKGMDVPKTGLALLREPFPAHQISKLPKPTAKQTQQVKDDFKTGIRCPICAAGTTQDVTAEVEKWEDWAAEEFHREAEDAACDAADHRYQLRKEQGL